MVICASLDLLESVHLSTQLIATASVHWHVRLVGTYLRSFLVVVPFCSNVFYFEL